VTFAHFGRSAALCFSGNLVAISGVVSQRRTLVTPSALATLISNAEQPPPCDEYVDITTDRFGSSQGGFRVAAFRSGVVCVQQ